MLKKRVISNDIVTVWKAHRKRALADVKYYCKMTSLVSLDGVTSFLRLKFDTYSCKRMQHSPTIGGISSAESWKKLKTSKCVFIVYCV